MASVMDLFKVMIVIMLFYSASITLLAYSTPADARNHVTSFSDFTTDIDLENVGQQVEGSLQQQTSMPVIELGALVFYSGNIILDLLLNFAFALPEMVGLLVNGILLLLNVDSYIWAVAELFAGVVIMVLYFIGIIQFIANIRSGKVIA